MSENIPEFDRIARRRAKGQHKKRNATPKFERLSKLWACKGIRPVKS